MFKTPGQTKMRVVDSSNSRPLSDSHALSSNLNLLKFFLRVVHDSRSRFARGDDIVDES